MISKNIYSPYFYVIKHIPSGMFYAGSRFGKNCKPSELLLETGYKTSSNTIHKLIKLDGLSSFIVVDIIEEKDIRIPFGWTNILDYETDFLKSNDCAKSEMWLNSHNNSGLLTHNDAKVKRLMILKYGFEICTQNKDIAAKSLSTRKSVLSEKIKNSAYIQLIKNIPKWISNKIKKPSNWLWLSENELEILYLKIKEEFDKPVNQMLLCLSDKERKYKIASMGHTKANDRTMSTRTASLKNSKERPLVLEILKYPVWFLRGKTKKNWMWFDDEILRRMLSHITTEWNNNLKENNYLVSISDKEKRTYLSIKKAKNLNSRTIVNVIRLVATSNNLKLKSGWWQRSDAELNDLLESINLNHSSCILL